MMGLRMVCLWPGLPGAWYRGRTPHLVCALLAGWLASLLLLTTFVWPQWFSLGVTRLMWGVAIVAWLGVSVWEHLRFSSWFTAIPQEATEAFASAQSEYLKGNWFAAEAQLLSILHEDANDVEALLLLVSVLRRTRRWQPALRRLKQMELLDAAYRWRFEIAAERRWIQQGLERSVADLEGATDAESTIEPDESTVSPNV